MIGAGIPGLYFLYREWVIQPDVILAERNIKYSKFLLKAEDGGTLYVYPAIHAHITFKNQGRASAKDCSIKLEMHETRNFFGRWKELNEQSINFHPKIEHGVVFMRFFPDPNGAVIESLKRELQGGQYKVDIKRFPELDNKRTLTSNNKLNICVQRPIRKAQEERRIEKEQALTDRHEIIPIEINGKPATINFSIAMARSDVFWGGQIEPKGTYKCDFNVVAENFRKKCEIEDTISVIKALESAKWHEATKKNEQYEGFEELRNILDKSGWKNI